METDVQLKKDQQDDPSSAEATRTFESSTAIIKFSGSCLVSDSESFSSDNEDETSDAHKDNDSSDPNKMDASKSNADSADLEATTPTAVWLEESWRSDSGFNSDNPQLQGAKQDATIDEMGGEPEEIGQSSNQTKQNKDTPNLSSSADNRNPREPSPDRTQGVKRDSVSSSQGSFSRENASFSSHVNDSPCSTSSERGCRQERFNPFNRVPFIDDNHYETVGSFPSVSGTSFPGDKNDFSIHRHENQSTSSDTDTDISLPSKDLDLALITSEDLGVTEDHFARPEGCFGFSRTEELEVAIEMCKDSVKETSEHSEQRRELINRLVQLRMKLLEIKEGSEEDPDIKLVLGHKFCKRKGKSSNHQCETCNSIIWGMLQSWHRCLECGYGCHSKCLNFVKRQCASSKMAKKGYILEICPESGLAAQNYRCVECRTQLSFRGDATEPRRCDYDGHYYCSLCHWNDVEVIPARVIHNWDFEARKVCRQSKQYLGLMQRKAVLSVQELNSMLFNYVEELSQIKRLREEILVMKMYFLSCRKAMEDKLLLQLQSRPHFVDSPDMYTLLDLIDAKDGSLLTTLSAIHSNYAVHIRIECPLCQARGFICELCNSDEVLYPFDMIATVCTNCSSVFHRDCFYRRDGECPKCARMSRRTSRRTNSVDGGNGAGRSNTLR